jgi:hypothetical protein
MSNRLEATDRIDIVPEVEGPEFFDQIRTLQQAEVQRGEELARLVGVLWRWAGAAVRRVFRSPAGGRDIAGLDQLNDHTLADIGLTRTQVPAFVAHEIAAARDIVSRSKTFHADLPAA